LRDPIVKREGIGEIGVGFDYYFPICHEVFDVVDLSKALVKSSEIICRCFLRAMDLEARWST